jgi:hypothetical protein
VHITALCPSSLILQSPIIPDLGSAWWFVPVVSATKEVEIGIAWFEASPGKS